MPHSDYISTYRLDGYNPRVHLSIYQPRVVASGTLTATPSQPAVLLNVSFAVGGAGDAAQGMLIRIRDTATQKVKGYTRVRYYSTASSSSIPVRELSLSQVACASGDTFEVLRYVPLDTKLTAADETFAPDGLVYAAQGSSPPPLACSGGSSVGWVDSGQTYRTIHTDGSQSSLVNPASSTPVEHFWVNDGSDTDFASGSSETDASPVIEANVGSWMLRHQVEDPDSGETVIQWTHHVVHDADHPPYDCVLTDYGGDHENGVSWTVELDADDVDPDDFYDLALAFLWVDDEFSALGVQDLHRSTVTGRGHILGMGYLRHVTFSGSGEDGTRRLSFDVQSPLARLQEIASYSKVMLEAASPDDWNEVKTLGFKRGITQLVQFYTTLVEAGYDFVYHSSFSDARYPAHYLNRADPIGQMRELVDARNGRLVNRNWGATFEVQYHPALLALADRTSTDLTLTADADVYEFEYPVELADSIEQFELQGITAGTSGNTSVFSRISPGGGKNAETIARKSPDSQTQANTWAGMVYAMRENVYQDSSGARWRVGELTLRLPGQYLVLDFSTDYVKFDYDGGWHDFGDFRFWLKRFSLDVDADTGEPVTTFVWQCETAAVAGWTFTPDTNGGGDDTPKPAPPPPTDPTGLPWGATRLALFQEDSTLRYTSTGSRPEAQGGPDWTSVDLTALTGWNSGDDLLSGVQKAFDKTQGWLVTDTRIYLVDDLPIPTAVTAQYTFPYAWTYPLLSTRFIQTERCHPTWAMCATWDADLGGTRVAYTTNGTTWSAVNVGATGTNTTVANSAFVWMSGRTAGLARVGTFSAATTEKGAISIYETRDYGANWSALVEVEALAGRPPQCIVVPYADESVMYVCLLVDNGSAYDLHIKQVVGTTVTDVTAQYSSNGYGAVDALSLRIRDENPNDVVLIGNHDNTDTTKWGGVFVSRTGVSGLSNVIAPATGNLAKYNRAWIGGDGTVYVAGTGGRFFVARNMLADGVLDERTGSGIGSARTLNLFGW